MLREGFIKYKVTDFLKHKKELINLIKSYKVNSLSTDFEKISNTDWIEKGDSSYKEYLKKNIMDAFLTNLHKNWNFKKITIGKIWFQVYQKYDFHDFHTHGKCHFTNVFYLNLPSKNLKTNIISLKNKLIDLDVEEGDILTFPAFLKHQSPINKCSEEKIIISFNINIE